MAAIIDYVTAFFSMLQDSVAAFRPRPAKTAYTPEFWMELGAKRHAELTEVLRPLQESLLRLEASLDRFERKLEHYQATRERCAVQQE